jgi:hypothetical protein
MIAPYSPEVEQQMKMFYAGLKEREQRHYAALEALKLKHGGKKYIQELFNIHHKTLKRAIDEVSDPVLFATLPTDKQRRPGGGRKKNNAPSQCPSPTSRPDRPI